MANGRRKNFIFSKGTALIQLNSLESSDVCSDSSEDANNEPRTMKSGNQSTKEPLIRRSTTLAPFKMTEISSKGSQVEIQISPAEDSNTVSPEVRS